MASTQLVSSLPDPPQVIVSLTKERFPNAFAFESAQVGGHSSHDAARTVRGGRNRGPSTKRLGAGDRGAASTDRSEHGHDYTAAVGAGRGSRHASEGRWRHADHSHAVEYRGHR